MTVESEITETDAEAPLADEQQELAEASRKAVAKSEPVPAASRNAITLSLRWDVLVLTVLLVASLACSAFLGWRLYENGQSTDDARAKLVTMQEASDARGRAEQVAMDYAKGASEMNYKDLPGWTRRLTANTTPELAGKLKEASKSMEQIIVPLQWISTSTPITAKVRSEHEGVFVVNCFVSVMTKNLQAPDGIQSTATYTVTVNKNDNWTVSDVGGVDSALKAAK